VLFIGSDAMEKPADLLAKLRQYRVTF